jgi:hypothetical protein
MGRRWLAHVNEVRLWIGGHPVRGRGRRIVDSGLAPKRACPATMPVGALRDRVGSLVPMSGVRQLLGDLVQPSLDGVLLIRERVLEVGLALLVERHL